MRANDWVLAGRNVAVRCVGRGRRLGESVSEMT